MKLTLCALAVAALLVLPFVSAAGESVSADDVQLCFGLVSCRLTTHMRLTVISCDAQNCTFNVRGSALGESYAPGLHAILMTAQGQDSSGSGGSLCASVSAVQKVLDLVSSCSQVCTTQGIGVEAGCSGQVNVNTSAPIGGSAGSILVSASYGFDQFAGEAYSSVMFGVRQPSNGTLEIWVYPG